MRIYLFTALLLMFAGNAEAEYISFWHKSSSDASNANIKRTLPERYSSYSLDNYKFRDYLNTVHEGYVNAQLIDLPSPDGNFRTFRVWKTPVMPQSLAYNYPGINTYTAEAIDAPFVTAKLDYTPLGFHALVYDGGNSYLIDPWDGDGKYLVYYQHDLPANTLLKGYCGVENGPKEKLFPGNTLIGVGQPGARISGLVHRRYRLALACTGEYAQNAVGANSTKTLVLADLTTHVNRVNGVFERDLSVTFQFVANETDLIYLDGSTDPFTSGNRVNLIGENQINSDNVIGNANYDIGQVMDYNSMGYAITFSLCAYGKGKATSVFDGVNTYLLMCHEIGHQFGANHTFNSGQVGCGPEANAASAFEPNSGSTILSYAGSCSLDNLQSVRDNYFHSRSLDVMAVYVNLTVPTCGINLGSGVAATIPAFRKSHSIPILTPFELTAPTASVSTKDTAVSYSWEEQDLGDFRSSLSLATIGPFFRSYPPDTSRTRIFPDIKSIIGKKPLNGEKLSKTARQLNFQMVARSIYQGWGAFNFPDDTVNLNVVNTGSAFSITSPSGNEKWGFNSQQFVTWNVVGTTAAPISCANVDIYLSVDSGYTYPILIKTNTPNDGSERVAIPAKATLGGKFKVKCSNNVFFNVSNKYFSIDQAAGTSEVVVADAIQISPVPAQERLTINIPAGFGKTKLQAINCIGQLVKETSFVEHTTIDVSGWPRGFYQILLQGENTGKLRKKVIVD